MSAVQEFVDPFAASRDSEDHVALFVTGVTQACRSPWSEVAFLEPADQRGLGIKLPVDWFIENVRGWEDKTL